MCQLYGFASDGAGQTIFLIPSICMCYFAYCDLCCVRHSGKANILLLETYRPCFSSSLMGLFNVVLNIIVRQLQPLDTLSIIVVTICVVSSAGYGFAVLYNSRTFFSLTQRPIKHSHGQDLLDDAELQRRQLLRLYLKQDSDRPPTPELSQSTFRLEVPETAFTAEDDRLVAAPPQTHERQMQPVVTPYDYELANVRGRSSSCSSQRGYFSRVEADSGAARRQVVELRPQ